MVVKLQIILRTLAALCLDIAFLGGLIICAYGCWLWFRPLGFMVGGLFLAASSFLMGYRRPSASRAGSEE